MVIGIDPKTFDRVAQISHVLGGLLVILGPKALWPNVKLLWVPCIVLWMIYAALKEFVWDEYHESPEVRGSSKKDFAFQVGGALLGLGLLVVRGML
jgi:hypothetical protein